MAAMVVLVRQISSDREIACTAVAGTVAHEPACTLAVPCHLQYPTPRMHSERNRMDHFAFLQEK